MMRKIHNKMNFFFFFFSSAGNYWNKKPKTVLLNVDNCRTERLTYFDDQIVATIRIILQHPGDSSTNFTN